MRFRINLHNDSCWKQISPLLTTLLFRAGGWNRWHRSCVLSVYVIKVRGTKFWSYTVKTKRHIVRKELTTGPRPILIPHCLVQAFAVENVSCSKSYQSAHNSSEDNRKNHRKNRWCSRSGTASKFILEIKWWISCWQSCRCRWKNKKKIWNEIHILSDG